MVFVAGGDFVENDSLLLILLFKQFDLLLIKLLLLHRLTKHLLQLHHVLCLLELRNPLLEFLDFAIVIFYLLLAVLDFFVADRD